MDHIIRRQLLELTIDSQQEPFDLQNRLNDHFYLVLLPILEKWFDHLSGEEEIIHIDQLVLDLGVFSKKEFNEQTLKERLTQKLQTLDILHSTGTNSTHTPQHRTTRQNAFEQWVWYMEKGYLPWQLLRINKEWENKVLETLATDYNAISRLRSILNTQPQTLTRIVLQHDEIFLQRLVEILTTVEQSTLPQTLQELRRLCENAPGLLPHTAHNVNTPSTRNTLPNTSPPLPVPSVEHIWQDTLLLAATMGRAGTTQQLGHRLFTRYWNDRPFSRSALTSYLTSYPMAKSLFTGYAQVTNKSTAPSHQPITPANPSATSPSTMPPSPPSPSPMPPSSMTPSPATPSSIPLSPIPPSPAPPSPTTGQPAQPAGSFPGQPDPIPPTAPSHLTGQGTDIPATINRQPAPTGPLSQSPNDTTPPALNPTPAPISTFTPDDLPDEGLFVANAGIILTHPFLNPLFKRVELLKEGKFIDEEKRQKAIHLLHYLATGHTTADEHELVFAKILCACPLDAPMKKQLVWTSDELQEGDALLEGLISHWGVKGISPEGLRGNYLTRNGKIYTKNDRMHITIEKHAIDILIRTYPLPWNMSIIKLPWFNQTIHLDW